MHTSIAEISSRSKESGLGRLTLVTATANSKSDIDWSVLLEKDKDNVITAGVVGSRAAWREIPRAVSLTAMVFSDGRPSGKAEEKAHSSSSAAAAGAAGGG